MLNKKRKSYYAYEIDFMRDDKNYNLKFEPYKQIIIKNGEEIQVTNQMIKFLIILMENKDNRITYDNILRDVFGYGDEINIEWRVNVRQLIFKVKKKIGKEFLDIKKDKGIKIVYE